MNGVCSGAFWFFPGVCFETSLGLEFELLFWATTGHWVVRKIVLYIVCFAYSLLLLLSLLLALLVFPLLPY